MTDYRIGQAHGYPLQVPAPEGVDEALAAVMAKHRAEIDEALAPFDLRAEDIIDPTWMVIVRLHDVEPYDEAEGVVVRSERDARDYRIGQAHDADCEADFGAEGQESACRCLSRAAEAFAAIAPGDILLASVTHGEVDGGQAPDPDARD